VSTGLAPIGRDSPQPPCDDWHLSDFRLLVYMSRQFALCWRHGLRTVGLRRGILPPLCVFDQSALRSIDQRRMSIQAIPWCEFNLKGHFNKEDIKKSSPESGPGGLRSETQLRGRGEFGSGLDQAGPGF
jgi:hypothetical protein